MASESCEENTSITRKPVTSRELLEVHPEKAYRSFVLNGQDPKKVAQPHICRLKDSGVLSKVKSFLPKIQQSNTKLEEYLKNHNPKDFDIENVEEGDAFVEMNIGVLSLPKDSCAAFDAMKNEMSNTDSEDSSSDDSLTDISLGYNIGEVTCSNMRTTFPTCSKPPMIKEVQSPDLKNRFDNEQCISLDKEQKKRKVVKKRRTKQHEKKRGKKK